MLRLLLRLLLLRGLKNIYISMFVGVLEASECCVFYYVSCCWRGLKNIYISMFVGVLERVNAASSTTSPAAGGD